jgi:hypothetical protein
MRTKMIVAAVMLILSIGANAQSDGNETLSAAVAQASTIDNVPTGGAETITINPVPAGLFLQPSFRFTQAMQGNSGLEQVDYTSTMGGSLIVTHGTQHDRFRLQYNGGAMFSTRANQENTSYQSVSLGETAQLNRWTLSLMDGFSYSPESLGSGSGLPAISEIAPNANLSALNRWLVPSQDILTVDSQRVSNSLVGQARYNFSYRNSATVGADYGVIRFADREFADTNQYIGFVSLERMLTAHDTLSLGYHYSAITSVNVQNSLHIHSPQVAYARKMTTRLVAHVSAGPEIVLLPVNTGKNIFWSSDVQVAYTRTKYRASLAGTRSTTGGAGLTLGSRTDLALLTLSRTVLRNWTASIQGGYSRTVDLTLKAGTFNARTYGGQLHRHVSQTTSAYISYSGQHQTNNTAIVAPFLLEGWRHTFGVGIEWHPRALVTRQ